MDRLLGAVAEFRDLLGTHILFTIGAMLLVGYMAGRLCARIGLPEITGYILAGILVSPTVFGLVPYHLTPSMGVITEVALGLIALTIGSEFSWVKLRRTGREIVMIAVAELVGVYVVVLAALLAVGLELPYALILAAIATASSPAVIVAIVQDLRAHGRFVDYLYGAVALVDAGTVILFGISFSVAVGLMGLSAAGAGPGALVGAALAEVVLSLVAGVIAGILFHAGLRNRGRTNEILLITLGGAFVLTAVAIVFHLSPLLVNMTAGAVLINLSPRHHRVFQTLGPLTPPIYALFFVLAGAELRLGILAQPQILLYGGAYVVSRALAKYGSVWLGAAWAKAPATIRDNLGLCLFPQAGVALGLVLLVQAPPVASLMSADQRLMVEAMVNVVLLSVFVNQIIGPPLATRAILRGNEMEE